MSPPRCGCEGCSITFQGGFASKDRRLSTLADWVAKWVGPGSLTQSDPTGFDSNEKHVLVVAPPTAAAAVPAQLADGPERGAECAEERGGLASGAADAGLHGVERLLDSDRDVAEQLVGALHLRGRELGRPRGVAADGVEMREQRLHLALELIRDPGQTPCGPACRHDAEEHVTPRDHALSRPRAC